MLKTGKSLSFTKTSQYEANVLVKLSVFVFWWRKKLLVTHLF